MFSPAFEVPRGDPAKNGLSRDQGQKVPEALEALSGLSLKKAMLRWSQSSTIAVHAEVLRQHEGSSSSLQRRNRPLRHVTVDVFSPKPVQWSNEEQVKAALVPFEFDLGLTSGMRSAFHPQKAF